MTLRFTPLHGHGIYLTIPIDRLNSSYGFTLATHGIDDIRAHISDPISLVIRIDVRMLIFWFRFFLLKDLQQISGLHGVAFRGQTKTELTQTLLKHDCKDSCLSATYVFKCMSRSRRNIHLRFVDNGEGSRASANERQNQNQADASPADIPEPDVQVGSSAIESEISAEPFDHLQPLDNSTKKSIIKEWQDEVCTATLKCTVCSVCGKATPQSEAKWVDGNDINLELLQNLDLPNEVLPQDYNFEAYNKAILNVKGLEFPDHIGHMRICLRCFNALGSDVMPKFALCNWLYYGTDRLPSTVKSAFEEANMFDRMLICRARANSIVCKFNARGEGNEEAEPRREGILSQVRKGVRGNIIVAPLDVVKMNEVLPPGPETIRDTMCAIFVGATLPTLTSVSKYSPILIRKSRVKTMIEFLLANNDHYTPTQDFQFSAGNHANLLDGGGDEGVPCYVQIGQVAPDDAMAAATSDYTPRNIDTYTAAEVTEGDVLMENVGYTQGDHSPLSYHSMKSKALDQCLQRKPVLLSGRGSSYVPDFHNPSILTSDVHGPAWLESPGFGLAFGGSGFPKP